MLICFTNNLSKDFLQKYINNLSNKKKLELFGNSEICKILLYSKEYLMQPMIFDGNEIEVEKHWGKGIEFIYNKKE